MKEEGSWRDLEICASPKVGGGVETSFHPPSLESGGGEQPLAPPVPTPMKYLTLTAITS